MEMSSESFGVVFPRYVSYFSPDCDQRPIKKQLKGGGTSVVSQLEGAVSLLGRCGGRSLGQLVTEHHRQEAEYAIGVFSPFRPVLCPHRWDSATRIQGGSSLLS